MSGSDNIFDLEKILSSGTELKRVFRWIMSFQGSEDGVGLQSWHCKTSNRPKGSFEEVVIDSLGGKKFIGGKFSWETIDVTLYDPLTPSAAKELFGWFKQNYNPVDGTMGYESNPNATSYKKDIDLDMTGPDGSVVEGWKLEGAWPISFDLGALDYAGNDAVEIAFTLRYDRATLEQAEPG
tara:strand:+ start:3526 stop:4068 length:543 start_codon:yes stop_codon:yes gene_type:complete